MKVLIGIDDSPYSAAALDFVRRMTWPEGTQILVVSAVRPAVAIYTEVYVPASNQFEQVLEDQTRYHEDLVSRAETSLRGIGLHTQGRVLQGDPREVLVETARRENADLIVMGSHGRSGLSKLLMGSVASHVLTHAHCDVLVVRLKEKPA